MPVTPAHALAVWPVMRWMRDETLPSALVIGSMIPDLVMWVDLGVDRDVSHAWPGLFTFCLPAGMAVLLLFHTLLEIPLYQLLPDAWARPLLARRLRVAEIDPLRAAWSIVLGAATHQAIDAFTHVSGPGMQLIPRLRRPPIYDLTGFPIYGFQLLQYGLSIGGLLGIAYLARRWAADRGRDDDPQPAFSEATRARLRVGMLTLIGASGLAWGWFRASQQVEAERALRYTLSRSAIGAIAAAGVVLLAWGVVWWLWHNGRTSGRHGPA